MWGYVVDGVLGATMRLLAVTTKDVVVVASGVGLAVYAVKKLRG